MTSERAASSGAVDWWPFTRLLITASILTLAAHLFLGWQVRPRDVLALSGQMFGVLAILAMISFVLADIYLLLFLGPLYVVGVLNHWFFDLAKFICRLCFRIRPGPALALVGLLGEVLLFGALGYALRLLLMRV